MTHATACSAPAIRRRDLVLGAAAAASTLAAPAWAQAAEEKVLNVYNWSDYIGDDTLRGFERETGIKVRYDNFDNNEILHAKLVANLRNLDPAVQAQLAKMDPGNEHLVNWLWGFTTVGINIEKVRGALGNLPMPDNVWDLLFKPEYISRMRSIGVSFLDSATEVVPAVLHYMGKPPFSRNPADYPPAANILKSIRPHVTLFSSSGYINDMASGSIGLALGWSGDINIARQRAIDGKTGQNIQALIPKNGGVLFFDTMAIPADAPRPGNAHKFIDYILRPEVHAGLTNKVFYANPNLESRKHVRADVASNPSVFLSPADMARMVAPDSLNNDMRRLMTRTYTAFKTGL